MPPHSAEEPEVRRPRQSAIVRLARQVGRAATKHERAQAIDRFADTVRSADSGWPVVERLLTEGGVSRRFALELVPRLPLPVAEGLIDPLREAITDGKLPPALTLAVATHLLCSLPPTGELTRGVIDTVIRDLKPTRALDRLRELSGRVMGCDALDERITRLEERVPMRCPRCRVKLPRPEMVKHLWGEHNLMLEGRRVREPWRWIASHLRHYAATGDPDLLAKANELAEQLDPETGLVRVQRLLLAAGQSDPDALGHLRDEAERRSASLCPHCYAVVPAPPEHEIPPMTMSRGRIACRGHSAEVTDRGFTPKLTVVAGGERVYRGREPGRWLTVHGRSFLLAGFWVALALLVAVFLPPRRMPPLLPTAVLLGMALLCHAYSRFVGLVGPSPRSRAVRAAWAVLVPELFRDGYSAGDGDFVASLAGVSVALGDPHDREHPLAWAVGVLTAATEAGDAPLSQLVAVNRLTVADADRKGRDAVLLLADEIGRSLAGALPLAYAERMLADWDGRPWWTRRNQARLRILLCARAFEAGLGVWELQELGLFAPNLGAVIRSDDLDALSSLRLLWEQTAARPWERFGQATPAFDLARYPVLGGQYLHAHPDLLLYQPTPESDENGYASPVLVCEEGVVYRDELIREGPVKVKQRSLLAGGGYELTAGGMSLTFRKRPTALAGRLSGWLRYLLLEFRPNVEGVLRSHNSEALERMLAEKRAECPDCGRAFLRGQGAEGMPVVEAESD